MGAGGGRCDGARVELRRPGLSAGGVGISMDFSTGRGTGVEGGVGFWAIGATEAWAAFTGAAIAEGGFELGLMVVPDVDLGFTFEASAVSLGAALGTGFAAGLAFGLTAFGTALLFVVAGLAIPEALTVLTVFTAAFGAVFTTGFLPPTGLAGALTAGLTAALALAVFSTALPTDLAAGFVTGFVTGLAVALLFWPVLTAAFAGVADFFVTAFTGCLLWEAASG